MNGTQCIEVNYIAIKCPIAITKSPAASSSKRENGKKTIILPKIAIGRDSKKILKNLQITNQLNKKKKKN